MRFCRQRDEPIIQNQTTGEPKGDWNIWIIHRTHGTAVFQDVCRDHNSHGIAVGSYVLPLIGANWITLKTIPLWAAHAVQHS
jgi:hypothetical protein